MKVKIIFLYLIAILFTQPLYAAAWLLEKGKGQNIHNFSYYSSNSFFDKSGDTQTQGLFQQVEDEGYLEYGLLDNLTIGGTLSFRYQQIDTGAKIDSLWGIGDLSLFGRYKLWNDDISVLSIQPLVKFDTGSNKSNNLDLGSDQMDGELRVLYGSSFKHRNQYHYTNSEFALRHHFSDDVTEAKIDLTLGYRLPDHPITKNIMLDNLMIMPQLFNVIAIAGDSNRAFSNSDPVDFDSTKIQLSIVKKLVSGNSLQLGAYSNIRGKNSSKGEGIIFSYWKNF